MDFIRWGIGRWYTSASLKMSDFNSITLPVPGFCLVSHFFLWHREGHPKRFNWIVTAVSQRPATDYWHGSGQWEGWGKQGHIAKFDDLLTFWRINLEAISIEIWIMIPHWYTVVYVAVTTERIGTCKIDHNRLSYKHTINIRQLHPKLQEEDILSFIFLWEANPSKWGIPTYQLPIKISKNRKKIWGKFGCVFYIVGPNNLIKFQLTRTNFDCVWGSLILKRWNSSASTQVCL